MRRLPSCPLAGPLALSDLGALSRSHGRQRGIVPATLLSPVGVGRFPCGCGDVRRELEVLAGVRWATGVARVGDVACPFSWGWSAATPALTAACSYPVPANEVPQAARLAVACGGGL